MKYILVRSRKMSRTKTNVHRLIEMLGVDEVVKLDLTDGSGQPEMISVLAQHLDYSCTERNLKMKNLTSPKEAMLGQDTQKYERGGGVNVCICQLSINVQQRCRLIPSRNEASVSMSTTECVQLLDACGSVCVVCKEAIVIVK